MNFKLNKDTQFLSLGMMDYKEAWDYQEELFLKTIEIKTTNRKIEEKDHQITPNYLIFLEHPHVYTLGKSGSEDNLLLDETGLKEKEATYYKINRGGDITYHGPGQIVGYPIIDLDNFFTDIHKYLRLLEEAVILTLKEYGIESGRIKGLTGVWIDYEEDAENPRKICALGVKSSRWVTMHGFAFNVNTNLNYFKNIIPCGIDDKAVTSMEAELGEKQDMQEVSNKLKIHIAELFEMKLIEGA
ncbi:lipoyl(octanoyl) transferase LipB [Marivirga salinae]|uniref:Octanoyltransferase n=1 Tax=Marivirga salinarum TaxID=3059078 RepID=A0AA49GBH1_9BACT|nr:lipoyl(octanoyl) transferase LipB [Marivirga sp. BDSF4-3]WKK73804.2 lipoyl(octanoyl) transferase LipB [Marivirga sp. BDSF4-3]